MSSPSDPVGSLQAEYTAAVARQRVKWRVANDAHLGPVERVIAYARWLAAIERVKSLSRKLDSGEVSGSPCPP